MVKAIIFDYKRTLVEGDQVAPIFFPESISVLKTLKNKGIKMAIVSVATYLSQRLEEFKTLNLEKYGISVFKTVGKEDRKDLRSVLDELQVDAKSCVVVGDRIKKEITEGNKIGAITVWLKRGKFADELPDFKQEEPNYTITSLDQLIPIIESL